MTAAVVIPNWNGCHLLPDCLDALAVQTVPARVIVVDNGSHDGSAEMVKSRYPDVLLVELEHNHGFAGGVNRGIQAALHEGAELVALLNNDALADEAWLEHLISSMRAHDDVGIVASKVLQMDGRRFDSAGSFYSIWGFPVPRGRGEEDLGQYDSPDYVFSGIGGASLYRSRLFQEVGFFDEDFFIYCEDDDLGFRAQLAGWKALYEPRAVVHHRIAATMSTHPGLSRHHTMKNFFFLYNKNMPMPLYLRYLPHFAVGFLVSLSISARRRQFGAIFAALWNILRSAGAVRSKRRLVQQSRVVDTRYVESMLYRGLLPASRRPLRTASASGSARCEAG